MSDDEVEITAAKGDDTLRNAPHSRFDCVVHPVDKDNMTEATCKVHCPQCFCYVCDEPASKCKQWAAHCVATAAPEWMQKRKAKREADLRKMRAEAQGAQAPDAPEVQARFAAAAAQEEEDQQAPQTAEQDAAREIRMAAAVNNEEEEELFAEYEPRWFQPGQPHPDPIVETTSLSFAEPPQVTYQLNLPKGLMQPKSADNPYGGALSRAQLETVSYACQRHESLLPSRERAGFFLGDGVATPAACGVA